MVVRDTPAATVDTGLPAAEDGGLRQQVAASLVSLLERMLRPGRPVTEDTTLMGELDLSSSRAMELLLEVEDNLSIAIDVDELDQDKMYTLGELADYIADHATAT